jgi:methylmalonyl-CoA mutase N-terminal domain/subunit
MRGDPATPERELTRHHTFDLRPDRDRLDYGCPYELRALGVILLSRGGQSDYWRDLPRFRRQPYLHLKIKEIFGMKSEDLVLVKKEKSRWLENVYNKIKNKLKERKSDFLTSSGIRMKELFTPADIEETDYMKDLGFPGEFPYTRGVQPTMYRGRFWTMRQYAGFGTAEDSNKRYRYLLEQGQTGLSVAFDLPTQMGYDSDAAMAAGEVGKVGVAIDSLRDMEVLFDAIPLDQVSTSMTINATASILLAMYVALAQKRGISLDKIRGTIQNDVLKEYIARGTYIYPPHESMRIITDIFAWSAQNLPNFNTISISGYHIREAGSSAAQEIAFTLADAIAYADAALKAGLDVDEFAGQLSFFFNVHNNFLEEIAKFRAARRMWARIMKERFSAKTEKSMMLRFHTQTAGSTLTNRQVDLNIVRVTIQALAAVFGGTQSLHTNSFDEALALPSENSVRVALRTQQVIAHESGVCDTADPFGGSYAIESLTNELEREATEYIKKIDEIGGVVEAINKGYIQKEIQDSSYKYQKLVETKDAIIVGVNEFGVAEEKAPTILRVDPKLEQYQVGKLQKVRSERDQTAVRSALAAVRLAAQNGQNLMPVIIDAVKVYATVGEISDVMRDVFGTYRETVVI